MGCESVSANETPCRWPLEADTRLAKGVTTIISSLHLTLPLTPTLRPRGRPRGAEARRAGPEREPCGRSRAL
eukprot:9374255-Heterocapsa_arctica.AAC.1